MIKHGSAIAANNVWYNQNYTIDKTYFSETQSSLFCTSTPSWTAVTFHHLWTKAVLLLEILGGNNWCLKLSKSDFHTVEKCRLRGWWVSMSTKIIWNWYHIFFSFFFLNTKSFASLPFFFSSNCFCPITFLCYFIIENEKTILAVFEAYFFTTLCHYVLWAFAFIIYIKGGGLYIFWGMHAHKRTAQTNNL